MDTVIGFHHAALTVRDVRASSEWYQRVLGMDIELSDLSEERSMVVLRLPGAPEALGLIQHGEQGGGAFDPRVVGLDHLAFRVAGIEDLEGWARRLDGQGVTHSGAIAIPPGALLNFKDPDGIALAFFWDTPKAEDAD